MRVAWFVFLVATVSVAAQQPIPNGDLESWQLFEGSGAFKDYEEPTGGWASGNGAIHVAPNADPVCEKTTNACSGMYAAKLTTRSIFGQIASGSLYTGRFELNLGNPRQSARLGMPYTDRPMRFTGYYKYLPVGGDSAVIRATFRRWNGANSEVVSEALFKIYTTVDEWTPFELVVPAFTADPDTVEVVFAASAGGEFFRGDVGSTLIIDDVAFDNTSSVSAEPGNVWSTMLQWRSESTSLHVDPILTGKSFTLFDYQGCVREHGVATEAVHLGHLQPGVYGIRCGEFTLMFMR